jgi:hypothetical protein
VLRSVARRLFVRTPLRRLMLVAPPLELDRERAESFAALAERVRSARGANVEYDLPYPLHEFTRFLVDHDDVLLHGAADPSIDRFEPRRQTDFDDELVHAVFASSDGIWPLFFAVLDRARIRATRNTCLHAADGSYYYFALDVAPRDVWTRGTLYVLPRGPFRQHADGTEWTSVEPVHPLARIAIDPDDFPFREHVFRFDGDEPPLRTLLRVRPGKLE